jgi:hypothetical protein
MTDGIIQEVFDKHLSDKKIHLGDYLMYKRIQQELIEKIKRELSEPNITTFGCNAVSLQTVLNKLIGDNQE